MKRKTKVRISILVSIVIPALAIVFGWLELLPTYAYIAGFSSLILGQISLLYYEFGTELEEITDYTKNRAQVEPIWESDFYNHWEENVLEAERRVKISYFDNVNPAESADEDKAEYYENIEDITRDMSENGVEFQRIVRAVPQTEEWIERMVENLEGVPRFSLACLPDNKPEERQKPHVSVQLIDDDLTYFVAVGEQIERNEPRDAFVQSEALNSQWNRYYDRIWENCFIVLERGHVQEDELERYREHIEEVQDSHET